MKTVLSCMAFLLIFAAASIAQNVGGDAKTQEKSPTLIAWEKLQSDFKAAMDEYTAPVRAAKNREDAAKARAALDPAKHPAKDFLTKLQEFSKANKGSSEAAESLIMTMSVARQVPPAKAGEKPDLAPAKAAFDELLADYADSKAMEQYASVLPRMAPTFGGDPRAAVETVLKKTKSDEVRAGAMMGLADFLSAKKGASDEDKAFAADYFAQIETKYAATQAGKTVIGKKWARENLAVGKPCPDEESVDENGAKFKISDYKGKVVVLDFWGIW